MPIDNPTQLLRIALVVIVSLLALFFATMIPSGDIRLPIFAVSTSILVIGAWLFPSWMTLLCIVFTMLPGRSGFGVGYVELLAMTLVARWLLIVPFRGDLFGKLLGKWTFLSVAGICTILIIHSAPSWFGSGAGRRLTFLALASMLFCYAILSGKVDLTHLGWLPWFGLVPGTISTGFELINLLVPGSLPITHFIYTSQNWEVIAEYGGAQLDFLRLSGLRELGLGLGILALSYFGTDKRWVFGRSMWQVLSTLVGAVLILLAGYRGYILRLALGTLLACFYRSKQTFIISVFGGALLIGSLIYTQNYVTSLPLPVQRSLSFLPGGDWDWRTKETADRGIGWREEIRRIYFNQIFPDSWLFGRGQTQAGEVETMAWMLKDPRFETEYYVLSQSYHSGLVSSLDFVGLLGTVLLALVMLRGCANCYWIGKHSNHIKQWHFWVVLYYLSALPGFWYTGFFNTIFPFFFIFLSLLEVARRDIMNSLTQSTVLMPNLDSEVSRQISS